MSNISLQLHYINILLILPPLTLFKIFGRYHNDSTLLGLIDRNTTSPALRGGGGGGGGKEPDYCASGIGLHLKWVRETL